MSNFKWCAIDAEGDVGNKGLLGVAFWSDEFQGYITDHEEISNQLLYHAQQGYTFLAHNASYDISVIFWQLHIPMRAVYFNGRFNRGEWKFHKRKSMAQLWDTLSLSGGIPLKELGEAIGYPKYPTPTVLTGKPDRGTSWRCDRHDIYECLDCYAARDAEIVYRFMVDFEALLAGWGIAPKRRIAALSVDAWKVFDRPTKIALSDHRMQKLSRQAYAGGRVETFKLGHIEHVYTADVSSMYPSVMLNTPYPDPQYMMYVTKRSPDRINWQLEGVAEVDITVSQMYIPPLPYMYHGERTFPVGRLRGCWTFHEIRYAVQLGCHINYVFQAAYSTRSIFPFTNFISAMWELRAEYKRKKDPRALFVKLLMNNLYGRIGMQDITQKRSMQPAPDGSSSTDWGHVEWTEIGDRIYLWHEKDENYGNEWSNVLWAAQTTAAARVKLHKLMLLQGNAMVYCDTDSIFSSAPIMGLGEGLGELSDPQELEWMYVAQPKLYSYMPKLEDMKYDWEREPCEKHQQIQCEQCRVVAKAKGVPRDLAYDFLTKGKAIFNSPVRPWEQKSRGIPAGTWVPVVKERQAVPHRRHPTNPNALVEKLGWSDTQPQVVGGFSVLVPIEEDD